MAKKKFAFMIHPREISDWYRRMGNMFGLSEATGMKYLPAVFPTGLAKWMMLKLGGRMGYTICSNGFDAFGEAEGYIIAVLLTGQQMVDISATNDGRKYVRERILKAIVFAQDKLGCDRIGLGAYTAPFTNNGLAVVEDKRIHCAITHGDGLSAATVLPAVQKCAAMRGVNIGNATIAVVGAYGLVGRAASLLLAGLGPEKMILTGPNLTKLQRVKNELFQSKVDWVEISTDNVATKKADIVVLATTTPTSIVTPEMLKANAIVVDMAQPLNMSPEVCAARPDVLRVDGGYMAIPGINLGFEMGPPAGTSFGCLTETMVSALIGDTANHVGPIDVNFAKFIMGEANKIGFHLAPLTNFSLPLGEETVVEERWESWGLSLQRFFGLFL
jgi:predicted amino acid dehydrogenase